MLKIKGKNGDLYKVVVKNALLYSLSLEDEAKVSSEFVEEEMLDEDDIVLRVDSYSSEIAVIHPVHGYGWISHSCLECLK